MFEASIVSTLSSDQNCQHTVREVPPGLDMPIAQLHPDGKLELPAELEYAANLLVF